MEALAGFGVLLFVAWLIAWIIMAVAAAVFLSRHDREGTGFLWVLLFGPLGLLMAFLKAEQLDQAQRDKEARELTRHALATREQEIVRAVATALAAHHAEPRGSAERATITTSPSSTSTPPQPRSYEEIMASEPKRPPRRFR